MKWSVGMKIGAGYALALAILLVIGVTSYRSTTRIIRAANLVTHTHRVLSGLEGLLSSLKDAETGERGYLLTGDAGYLEPYHGAVRGIEQQITELRTITADNPGQQRELAALEPLVAEKLAGLRDTIGLRRSQGLNATLREVRTGRGKRVMDEIRGVVAGMESAENALLQRRAEQAKSSADNTVKVIAIGIPLSFIVLFLAGFAITRNIAGPLKRITAAAEQIAAGDLSISLPALHRGDEVGALAQAFTRMTGSWSAAAAIAKSIAAGDLSAKVVPLSEKDAMGQALCLMLEGLRQTTREISEGIAVISSSSSEIMASIAQVASSATQTAAAVSETTGTVEQVKHTVQLASAKSKSVSETAQESVQTAKNGRKAVEESVAGMGRIQQQVGTIAESIVKLSANSQVIGEIIATVNDLAEQSNLLSVNAAIEAAKAGEQGRGFAVVAHEVKSLAEQSKEATAEIRTILTEIQNATNAAVLAAEQGSRAVEEGVQQSRVAGEAIRQMGESIEASAQAALQIAASGQQQLQGMDQVARAMEDIQLASEQNLSGVKQVERTVQDLHELGQRLQEQAARYKV
jgi:methyl-accepting chemotaxis protein